MDLGKISIHKWILDHDIKNEKGQPIKFNNHLFLYDIYSDWSQEIVLKKSAQVGASTMMNIKMAFAADSPMFRTNTIYTLPTDGDVSEFVSTKTDKIIQQNPVLKEKLGKDNVFLKEFSGRFVYFKGTRSKSAAIMTTAELLIKDEIDRSDQNVLSQFKSRTLGYKGEGGFTGAWELSNPSVVNYGVDLSWKRSDQKEWFIKCPKCAHEQILRWDKNVDFKRGVYVCESCSVELSGRDRILGEWRKTKLDSQVSGYHISNLMAPWISAKDLIKARDESDEEVFSNFFLGEPYSSGDIDDFRRIVFDCWTPKPIEGEPYIMGVDVGRTKHYVLGNSKGIFKIGTCREREELEELIERYNPWVLMDAGPERTWAEEFRQKYPKFNINFYKRDRDTADPVKWGENEQSGIVWSDRSRTIDQVVNDMLLGEILFDVDPHVLGQYVKHWAVMVKKREVDALGRHVYTWDKNSETAADHWVHATNYYNIMRKRAGEAVHIPGTPEKAAFIQIGPEGEHKMQDLEDYWEKKKITG